MNSNCYRRKLGNTIIEFLAVTIAITLIASISVFFTACNRKTVDIEDTEVNIEDYNSAPRKTEKQIQKNLLKNI